ncbi:hypothetical protein T439DRAFT_325625 [Meredithblackwellia eburnea MCA 4105]
MGVEHVGFDLVHQSHHWIDLNSPEPTIKFACAFALFNSFNIKDIYEEKKSDFVGVLDLDGRQGDLSEANPLAEAFGSADIARSVGVAILGRAPDKVSSRPAHFLRKATISTLSIMGRFFFSTSRKAEKMKSHDDSKEPTSKARHEARAKEGPVQAQLFTAPSGTSTLSPTANPSEDTLPDSLSHQSGDGIAAGSGVHNNSQTESHTKKDIEIADFLGSLAPF